METLRAAAQNCIPGEVVDPPQALEAVRALLRFIGEDPEREGLVDTPARVAKAMREMTGGYTLNPAEILSTTFNVKTDELVVVRDISFQSMCEHHMLPFTGVAHVAYLSRDRVVGLSKIPRLVECFARRLQVQERLTGQIAHALMDHLDAQGAAVCINAKHACMINRGVKQSTASMVTSALLGTMRENAQARAEFFALIA